MPANSSIAGGHQSTKIEDRTVSDEWYQDSVDSRWRTAGKVETGVHSPGVPFEVTTYLNYQGSRFVARNFDPNSYIVLYVCSVAPIISGRTISLDLSKRSKTRSSFVVLSAVLFSDANATAVSAGRI